MTTFNAVSNGALVQASDLNQYYTYLQAMLTYRSRLYLNFQQQVPPATSTRVLVNTATQFLDPAQMIDPYNNGIRIPAAGIWRITGRIGLPDAAGVVQITAFNSPAGGGSQVMLTAGTWGTPTGPNTPGMVSLFSDMAIFGVGDLLTMSVWVRNAVTVGPDPYTYLSAEFIGPTS